MVVIKLIVFLSLVTTLTRDIDTVRPSACL